MNTYCLIEDCKQDHCKYGVNGEKKMHLTDCRFKHCYGCLKHNVLEIDEKGFVISWYCKDCLPKRPKRPSDWKPKTVEEMQERIALLKQQAKELNQL